MGGSPWAPGSVRSRTARRRRHETPTWASRASVTDVEDDEQPFVALYHRCSRGLFMVSSLTARSCRRGPRAKKVSHGPPDRAGIESQWTAIRSVSPAMPRWPRGRAGRSGRSSTVSSAAAARHRTPGPARLRFGGHDAEVFLAGRNHHAAAQYCRAALRPTPVQKRNVRRSPAAGAERCRDRRRRCAAARPPARTPRWHGPRACTARAPTRRAPLRSSAAGAAGGGLDESSYRQGDTRPSKPDCSIAGSARQHAVSWRRSDDARRGAGVPAREPRSVGR
jgi:hypothetical protein